MKAIQSALLMDGVLAFGADFRLTAIIRQENAPHWAAEYAKMLPRVTSEKFVRQLVWAAHARNWVIVLLEELRAI